jgi:hypothetical protein
VIIAGRDKPAIKMQKKVNEMMELHGYSEKDRKKARKDSLFGKSMYDKKGEIKI